MAKKKKVKKKVESPYIKRLKNTIEKLKSKLAESEATKSKLEAEIRDLKLKLSEKEKIIENTKNKIKELEEKIASLEIKPPE